MSGKNFDLGPLLEAVGGDNEIMGQVITMFVTTASENLTSIHEAIVKNDAKQVKVTAHHLKGSLLELNAKEAVALALELEKMGDAQTLDGAEALWKDLDRVLKLLVTELDQTTYRRSA